jgi:hypothetical protein
VISNTSTTTAVRYYGNNANTLRVESGCEWNVVGDYIVLQDSGGDWNGDGLANQTIPSVASTDGWEGCGYDILDEPPVIFVETGSATNVWTPYLRLRATQTITTDVGVGDLGNFFIYDNTTGIITFGDNGATNAGKGGNIPASGARCRVYNVSIGTANTAGVFTHEATQTNNFDTDTGDGGVINLSKCYLFGFYLYAFKPSSLTLTDVGNNIAMRIQTAAGHTMTRVYSPQNDHLTTEIYNPYILTSPNAVHTDCIAQSYQYNAALYLQTTSGMTITNGEYWIVNRNSTGDSAAQMVSGSNSCAFTGTKFIGGRINLDDAPSCTFTNIEHSDTPHGTANATNMSAMFQLSTSSQPGSIIDGLTLITGGTASAYSGSGALNGVQTVVNVNYEFLSGYVWGPPNGGRMKACYVGDPATGVVNSATETDDVICQNVTVKSASIGRFQENSALPNNVIYKGCDSTAALIPTTPGAVKGTHFYEFRTADASPDTGIMGLFFTPESPSSSNLTISGDVKFDFASKLYILDSTLSYVEFLWPHVIKGVLSFANIAPTVSGTNTSNFTIEYKIDTGSGFSALKTLNALNLSGETITAGSIDGFAVRITANGNAVTDNISKLYWETTVDNVTYPYPIDVVSVVIENVADGSEYRLYNTDTSEVLATGTQSGSGDITVSGVAYSGSDETLQLDVRKGSSVTNWKPFVTNATLTSTGANIYVIQTIDTINTNP